MRPSTRLPWLRFRLARAFAAQAKTGAPTTPGLHQLLAVPIKERLVLLAKIDGADPRVIQKILPVSKDDAELVSDPMRRATKIWLRSLSNPAAHWPSYLTRPDMTPDRDLTEASGEDPQGTKYWSDHYGARIDTALGKLLWADVAVALIGEGTLPEVADIPLRRRLLLYLVLVEGMRWDEVMELMDCSNWELRQAILDGLRATGGIV